MARLVYSTIGSLDGYSNDRDGNFEWAAPDEEVHAFVNDLERGIGTILCGRRLYEVMAVWDDATGPMFDEPVMADFARIWQAADKIVFSTTLESVSAPRTRLERSFDPEMIGQLKATADRDISIGGPELAAHAIRAGLVDEWELLLHPILVGGGAQIIPDDVHVELELVDQRRFASGVIYLHYRSRS